MTIKDEIIKFLGYSDRMLSGSKALYCQQHPNNRVYFNANVITESGEKIWFGDIDLTLESDKLRQLANVIGCNLYVLKELDYRFDTTGRKDFKKVSVWNTEVKHG